MTTEFRDSADPAIKHALLARTGRHVRPSGDRRLDAVTRLGNATVGRVLRSARVQRAGGTAVQRLDESVARAIEERRGRGRPLDDGVREEMEASLGHDLSDVQVHADSAAHELNEAVSGRAFTTGNDVFFKHGTFSPRSSSGRELLAHELTHVVQQRTGTSGLGAGEISHPSDAAEQKAAEVGRLVAGEGATRQGETAGTNSGDPAVARDAELDDETDEGVAGSWESGAVQRQDDGEEVDEELS